MVGHVCLHSFAGQNNNSGAELKSPIHTELRAHPAHKVQHAGLDTNRASTGVVW